MVYIVLVAEDYTGLLSDILQVYRKHEISLKQLSSRQSPTDPKVYEFVCEFEAPLDKLNQLTTDLSAVARVKETEFKGHCPYPKCLEDLDGFSCKTLEFGDELSADHPGFTDEVYRKRRAEITKIAQQYRTGMAIPEVEYTAEEIKTWGFIWDHLTELFKTHACIQHQTVFPLLVKECGYSRDRIPQLQKVRSQYSDNEGESVSKETDGIYIETGYGTAELAGLFERIGLSGVPFNAVHSAQLRPAVHARTRRVP